MKTFYNIVISFLRYRKGVSATQYVLILTGVAIALIFVFFTLNDAFNKGFQFIVDTLNNAFN